MRAALGVAAVAAALLAPTAGPWAAVTAARPAVSIVAEQAGEVLAEVRVEYVLSEADSLLEARAVALRKAKFAAVEELGTYIQAERVVRDGKLDSEVLRSYSAAFLSTEVLEESLEVRDGVPVLSLRVRGRLDRASLERKIEALLNDPAKERQIARLEQRNAELRARLARLTERLHAAEGARPVAALRQEREALLGQLEATEEGIRHVFHDGALAQRALQAEHAFEMAREDLNDNLWGAIASSTRIRLGEPVLNTKGNGRVDVLIPVEWSVEDVERVDRTLSRYFRVPEESSWTNRRLRDEFKADRVRLIARRDNTGLKQLTPYSQRLLQEVVWNRIVRIEVTLGERTESLAIAGGGTYDPHGFDAADPRVRRPLSDAYDYLLILASSAKAADGAADSEPLGVFNVQKEKSPVVFEDVPLSELQTVTDVSARVVVDDWKKSGDRSR